MRAIKLLAFVSLHTLPIGKTSNVFKSVNIGDDFNASRALLTEAFFISLLKVVMKAQACMTESLFFYNKIYKMFR